MQSAGPGQTGVERGVENIVSVEQKFSHVFESEALQKIFRRDASPSGKEPVKMKRTQTGCSREPGEIGLLGMMSI